MNQMNETIKLGLFALGNLVITCLVILLYHFYINKPLVINAVGAGKPVYTVNSKKLLQGYEEQIKAAVLSGDLDKAETIKQNYISYLGKLETAAKQVADQKGITIFVSDAVVESKSTIDLSKLLENLASKK